MRASEVEPKRVEWLWYPWVPFGKISGIAGQMGQFKSGFNVFLAALTTPSGVVMYNAEDDAADTIRPRLEAAGADLDRVEIITDALLSVEHLASMCDELGDVRLVTVDPIQAYLPAGVNSWKGQDIRLWAEPYRQLAAEREFSLAVTQHPTYRR